MSMRFLLMSAAIVAAATYGATAAFSNRDQSASVDQTVDETLTHLNIPKNHPETIREKAFRVRNAIKKGDFKAARSMIANVLSASHMQLWRFYPLGEFMQEVTKGSDPVLEPNLDAWVKARPGDPIPLLLRAQFERDMAWTKRGDSFIRKTSASQLAGFAAYQKKALADINDAIQADGSNPFGYYLKLRILHGYGLTKVGETTFKKAIAKFPDYYPLYDVMFNNYDPRWGGSVAAMYAFVDRYAGHAPQYSPLKLLYVKLYGRLLTVAELSCETYHGTAKQKCFDGFMQKVKLSPLPGHVSEALALYDHTDKVQFATALYPLLNDIVDTTGAGDAYAATFLQTAADSLHSNTQLVEDHPAHNDYIIDKSVADRWFAKHFFDNAITKDHEALKDIERTTFANESDKASAISSVYEDIARASDDLHHYSNMIAYEKAAFAVGGRTDFEFLACFGYYKLNAYQRAIAECTKTIGYRPDNMYSWYYRGLAYRDTGNTEKAIADLTKVAESGNPYRDVAAIAVNVIYGNSKDFKSAIAVFDKYPYLLNTRTTSESSIAVSYNNRCYDYMQIGQYKKALDDCTMSLTYDTIPDAVRKKQQLLKLLKRK
jgi:hypothetical protein